MKRHRLAAAISLVVASHFAFAAPLESVRPQRAHADVLTDATVANSDLLLLRAGLIDPTRQRIDYAGTGAAADVSHSRYALVQFERDDRSARERLRKLGYTVVSYVPNYAYVVEIPDARQLEQLRDAARGRWAGYFQPGMKLDPTLYVENYSELQTAPQGGYEIQIFGFAGTSAQQIAATLSKLSGASVTALGEHRSLPNLRLQVPAQNLGRLIAAATALEGVAYVGHYAQPFVDNSASIGTVQGNYTGPDSGGSGTPTSPAPMFDHSIFGSGQIVAVSDSGVDANEAWFTTLDKGSGPVTAVATASSPVPPAVLPPNPNNKIINYWVQPGATAFDNNNQCTPTSPTTSWHGSHVAGTIAGDAAGNFGPTYLASTPTALNHELADGMAPNAQLLVQDIGNDTTGCLQGGPINDMFGQAVAGGARIHSASWGARTAGAYSANDVLADLGLHDNPALLFVVSAGNEGPTVGSTGTPGNAKNALTVGMLGHAGSLTVNGGSSRGPTDDGRIKPDISAPGTGIASASGDSTTNATPEAPVTKLLTGTSMAAPTVSGSAALMRQYFADGWYPRGSKTAADLFNPGGMVMKAALLNGTNPIATAFGSNNTGWGRVWLDGNLYFSTTLTGGDDNRRLRLFEREPLAGVRTGDQHEYRIQSVAAGQELRATLTWYDVPGAAGAAIGLVNNLDLEVVDPASTVYRGNVFTSGASVSGGTADARNTVEQVRLTAPTAGTYTIRVKATNVPGDGSPNSELQGYGLAVSGAFGLPATAALAAPTLTSATTVGNTGQVAFSGGGVASSYQLYRATGTCASAAAGDFHLVGTGTASPLVDTTTQGGYQYAYKVRGIGNDVEGSASNCVDMTSTAACTLDPVFTPSTVAVTATDGSNCHVAMGWQAGVSNCPAAPLGYKVFRDTSFAFAAPILLGTASGASYDDTMPNPRTPYFYRVEAVDGAGNSGGISSIQATTAVGPGGVGSSDYFDNADNAIYMLTQTPWHLSTTAPSGLGGRNYFMGYESSTYRTDACTAMATPQIAVQAGASTLSFDARYDIEHRWDGVAMQISTNGGSTWSDLPPDGGYPSSFADTQGNGCNFPASQGAFNGVTTAASNADPGNGTVTPVWKPFTRNLSSYVGQTVRIRWIFSSDSGAEFQGFFLDNLSMGGTPADTLFAEDFEVNTPADCN